MLYHSERIIFIMNSKALALLLLMSFMAIQFNSVQGMSQGDILIPFLFIFVFIYLSISLSFSKLYLQC